MGSWEWLKIALEHFKPRAIALVVGILAVPPLVIPWAFGDATPWIQQNRTGFILATYAGLGVAALLSVPELVAGVRDWQRRSSQQGPAYYARVAREITPPEWCIVFYAVAAPQRFVWLTDTDRAAIALEERSVLHPGKMSKTLSSDGMWDYTIRPYELASGFKAYVQKNESACRALADQEDPRLELAIREFARHQEQMRGL